jgi:ADP-L-glycero-D-manno-heptose 6-epimerase
MILVTGSEGFIGEVLCAQLPFIQAQQGKEKEEIFRLDMKTAPVFGALDLIDWSEISEIYHQGAISSTTELDLDKIYKFNVKFSIELFKKAIQYKIPVRYASSGAVFGNSGTYIHNPLNYYATSKMLVDMWVMENIGAFEHIVGYRYFNVYGDESGKGQFDISPIYRYIQQAKNQKEITVWKGSENTSRDFIHVGDVVDTITQAEMVQSGIYDLGTGVAVNFVDIANMVAEKYGVPVEYKEMPNRIKGKYQFTTTARWQGRANRDGYITVKEYIEQEPL